jgi:hypothetical protein
MIALTNHWLFEGPLAQDPPFHPKAVSPNGVNGILEIELGVSHQMDIDLSSITTLQFYRETRPCFFDGQRLRYDIPFSRPDIPRQRDFQRVLHLPRTFFGAGQTNPVYSPPRPGAGFDLYVPSDDEFVYFWGPPLFVVTSLRVSDDGGEVFLTLEPSGPPREIFVSSGPMGDALPRGGR